MSSPADVVRHFCALMEQRDAEALRPLLAEGAIYQNVGMPAFTGPDAIVENMAAQFTMFPDAYAFENRQPCQRRFRSAHRAPGLHPGSGWKQAGHPGNGDLCR